jgi:hypothetical protein
MTTILRGLYTWVLPFRIVACTYSRQVLRFALRAISLFLSLLWQTRLLAGYGDYAMSRSPPRSVRSNGTPRVASRDERLSFPVGQSPTVNCHRSNSYMVTNRATTARH